MLFNYARHLPLLCIFFSPLKQFHHSLSPISKTLISSSNPPCLLHFDLLSLSSSLRSLNQTKQSHAFALILGLLPSSVSLCAALMLKYSAFGDVKSCGALFESTVRYCKTVFLWNTFMRSCLIDQSYEIFSVYNRMIRVDMRPDDHTFPCVLKACSDYRLIQKGKEVHGFAVKVGLESNLYVGNTLLLFYGSFGDLSNLHNVFDGMSERDGVSWNTMIKAFSDNGFYREAIDVFMRLKLRSGYMPNVVSVVSVLPVCSELGDEVMARLVHGYVIKVGFYGELTICSALTDVYGKCGNVNDCLQVFDEITDRNVVSWNTVITSFAHLWCYNRALEMFRLMIDAKEKPNDVTISSILPVITELGHFEAGKEIHGLAIRTGINSDLFVGNSLIDMYAKSGHSDTASYVFYTMDERNAVSWNAMIANYAQNDDELSALEFLRQMQAQGVTPNSVTFTNVLPACAQVGFLNTGKEIHARSIRLGFVSDIFISNALTDMYSKCGSLNLAQIVFDASIKDEISYNILIVGYSQTSDSLKSLKLFKKMGVIGMQHDTVSYVGVLSACANLSALKHGREIHGIVTRKLFYTHTFVVNSLLDLYTKSGKIGIAQRVFEWVPNKDAASWNTMILGYGMLGNFEIAINLFEAMRNTNIYRDSVSFIAVLSACSHGGIVEKGRKYFKEMEGNGIKPTHMHYTCMVDLLGRAGLLDEAMELIREIPFEPDANIWGALLGACRIHGNLELARLAAEHLFMLKPEHCGYYMLFLNMLSEFGRWDEVERVRELVKFRGMKKSPAYSWIQLRNEIHAFLVCESKQVFGSG